VKLTWQKGTVGLIIYILFCANGIGVLADAKYVRLRNELIRTPSKGPVLARPLAIEPPVSGLYLVQFEGRLQSAWRQQLQAAGVILLRFVPDDAFVVRLSGARLDQVRALPFVRWIGEYRSEYKMPTALMGIVGSAISTNLPQVRVLFSPDVTTSEAAMMQRVLGGAEPAIWHRFGSILSVQANAAQLRMLANSPAVMWIERGPQPRLLDEVAAKIVGGENPDGAHLTATQVLGFDGRGVVVSVADSGLNTGDAAHMHPDLLGRVDAFFYYGNLLDAADEHGHGTHVAGIIAGDGAVGEMDEDGFLYGLGVAPGVRLIAQRIFDGAGLYMPPPSNERLTRDAVRAGAVIGSNSWGDDTHGRYDLSAAEFDALVRDADAGSPGDQPYILEFSAGNSGPGPQTIGSPAVAKNVIATGASQNDRTQQSLYTDGPNAMADFSSRGPCEDGRIKPDLVAPGAWIASLQSELATGENAWLPISEYYQYQGGTSQSGPQVSGAAAVFVQYYREAFTNRTPSPALVKAALINAAADLPSESGTAPVPNFDEGWGRVDLTAIIGSPRRYEFLDQSVLLTTGQVYEQRIFSASRGLPLKVTLTYTDVPGLPAAIPALVNDLDLEVIGPDGSLYRGNQFDQGESVADAPTADNLNNVEAVHLLAPAPGEYLIRVRAQNVVEDARPDTPSIDQDFALVVSGDLPLPGVGLLVMDRSAYSAPARIQLKLIDQNLLDQSSISLLARSTTEPNGEIVFLHPQGISGIYTGYLDTATGPAITDGRLQVNHGDTIEAYYLDLDANPPGIRRATARADLMAPALSQVIITNQFGKVIVEWLSDEPANSVVLYGTDRTNLNLQASNSLLTETHYVALDNLVPDTTYWCCLVSTDVAGNSTTNNNDGQYFELAMLPAATVLLVNAYVEDPPGFDSIFIPIETYTDALDQTQVSYELWNVGELGRTPSTNDLRPFRVVIWRISDSIYNETALSPADQDNLQQYLEGGGSLLMTSMELLSRLGSAPFRMHVLHVQSFEKDAGVPSIYGVDYDPVTSGVELQLDYSSYPVNHLLELGPDVSDTLTPTTNAVPILFEGMSNRIAGLRYPRIGEDSSGRVVFLSFPLDAVPIEGKAPNNRANLLRNILSFLAPGANGLGTVALDNNSYTIPSRVTIEMADSDLSGLGKTTVQCYSDSDANGETVVMQETVRRGMFRGSVTVVARTDAPMTGHIRAREGDRLWVEYLDQSASGLVRAAALIDTFPARITKLVAEPSYVEATITWATSEPTDALVQFGESTFLSRTAYRAELRENHQLTLSGLLPDRAYYFQVVSRDAAGNPTIDDNNGKLYLLHTLKPWKTPWRDDLEPADTNWMVIDGDYGTSTSWQLGPPQVGGLEAHSPTNAWGSNLAGIPADTGDTTLISPAIELTGGNHATLRFWHYYDFTKHPLDLYEIGQLNVTTNDGNAWVTLTEYSARSEGWEEVQVDLTPYLGKVIRMGWYYGLFSLEPVARTGWLIDDVSLTVTNVPLGTVLVSNNLAQAQFRVSGPANHTGRGWNLVLTNAPEGEYVVAFNPVAYYQTPAPQTNALSGTNLLLFLGNYTFLDDNTNGVSDAWEQAFFGQAAPPNLILSDSDGDGASDFTEFFAGTDPTDALSVLELSLPVKSDTNVYRLLWPSSVGYAYRVETSMDLEAWSPASDWIRATSTSTSFNLTNTDSAPPYYFRLEVRP
jgi:subtilisin family serine protease